MKTKVIREFEEGDIVISLKYVNALIRWVESGVVHWQNTNGTGDLSDARVNTMLDNGDYVYIGNRVDDFGANPWVLR